jgi:hypothetical protein
MGDETIITMKEGPDPRWGMQAPLVENITVTTPINALELSIASERTVDLADISDPWSLVSITDQITVNGAVNPYITHIEDTGVDEWTVTSTTPMGKWGITKVNDKGRPISQEMPVFYPVAYEYDTLNRLEKIIQSPVPTLPDLDRSSPNTRITSFTYYDTGPSKGYLESVTDP